MNWKGHARELRAALEHVLAHDACDAICLKCADARSLAARGRRIECDECKGTGEVAGDCDDPQCGDSTWDHFCNAGSHQKCARCEGAGTVSSLE